MIQTQVGARCVSAAAARKAFTEHSYRAAALHVFTRQIPHQSRVFGGQDFAREKTTKKSSFAETNHHQQMKRSTSVDKMKTTNP